MRAQSEALRLADALEADQQGIDLGAEGMGWWPSTATRTQAAAELRRLYAEVDRLSYQLAYPDNFERQPLTDEEIEDIWADCPADWDDKINVLTLARAIEAAHGIYAPSELKENT